MLEVSERSGVAREAIASWRRRHAPSLANFVAALNVLDLELVIRERAET